jgi:hypothetical protein
MIQELLIVPNFFDNPEKIVNVARTQKFYKTEDHPENKNSKIKWGGYRTEELSTILDVNIFSEIKTTLIKKVFLDNIASDAVCNIEYSGSSCFQLLLEDYKTQKTDIHKDSVLFAGVVYLNDISLINPKENGTIVFNNKNEEFIMPFVYNTLIFYRADYMHAALNGFGKDINDCRITISFFIESINLNLFRKSL